LLQIQLVAGGCEPTTLGYEPEGSVVFVNVFGLCQHALPDLRQ
jgi:hypothetical protein